MKGGKWDNCNSIINKYIFKNDNKKRNMINHTHTHKKKKNEDRSLWDSTYTGWGKIGLQLSYGKL